MVLLESVGQPFHPLAEAIESAITRPRPPFVLLAWHSDADTVAPEVLANLAAAVSFVAHEATRPVFGMTAPTSLDGSACP
jgi:hypothetical protein